MLNNADFNEELNIKPFVKWAGGKTQLLELIKNLLPIEFNQYYEPFLGGGSLFLKLQPKKAIISDANEQLINTWSTIKNNHKQLQIILKKHVKQHNVNPEETYFNIRENYKDLSKINLAARFIYLNKTGFNGLYRVNKNNKFNVPLAKKSSIKNSTLFNAENFQNISRYLQEKDIKIENNDYKKVLQTAKKGDFAFIDPPYDSDKNIFNSYTSKIFGKEQQRELAQLLKKLDKKGVKWMLTNHNTELINELYKNYQIYRVPVNRFVNSDGNNRHNATEETIIINYKISLEQHKKFRNELFFKQLKTSSFILREYVSWDQIRHRLNEKKIFINDLNLLITTNKKNFNDRVNELFERNRFESFQILPLLLGNRIKKNDKFNYLLDDDLESSFDFNSKTEVSKFLEISGLRDNLFLNPNTKDLNSYVFGTEVGLTSSDKKNKSGKVMTYFLQKILDKHKIKYEKEVKSKNIFKIEIKESKTFDFVFWKNDITFCLETNFFNGGGSKINSETERFIALNESLKNHENVKFIWVTDGPGLRTTKNRINFALSKIEHMYNLKTFEEFLENKIKNL